MFVPRAPKHLWKQLSATWLLLWCPRDLLEVVWKTYTRPGINSKSPLFQSSALAARPPASFPKVLLYSLLPQICQSHICLRKAFIRERACESLYHVITCGKLTCRMLEKEKPGFYCSCLKTEQTHLMSLHRLSLSWLRPPHVMPPALFWA